MKPANFAYVILPHLCHQMENNVDLSSYVEEASILEGLVGNLDSHEEKNNVKIIAVKVPTNSRKPQRFEGACVDFGAQKSVIGENQADLYCNSYKGKRKSTESKTAYQCGNIFSIALVCYM